MIFLLVCYTRRHRRQRNAAKSIETKPKCAEYCFKEGTLKVTLQKRVARVTDDLPIILFRENQGRRGSTWGLTQ